MFVLAGGISRLYASSVDAETISEGLESSYLLVAADMVEIVAAVLAVNVVRGVNARLEDQASNPHQSAQR